MAADRRHRSVWGLMHSQCDQFGVLSVMNFVILGAFYAFSAIAFRSIWFGVDFHLMWDYAQVTIFGLAYAGGSTTSIITIDQTGPALWVGGNALIEASLLYTLMFSAMAIGAFLVASRINDVGSMPVGGTDQCSL